MTDHAAKTERLGNYELLELLEEDAMGKLYRARDRRTGQDVLLKLLATSVSHNPAFRRYLYDKWADRRSLIEHPNVLNVLEAGREGNRCYAAVEDVGGERLTDRMQAGPLPLDEGLDIVRQVAEGLRAAHRRDVVHGHLKPTDVILTTDQMGRRLVKVVFLDLGVCPTDSVVSVFGEVMGAPKYMAPEVIKGRLPDPQADIFALGVVAYEVFTGREPFSSDHAMGYLFANCELNAPAADEAREDLPHELALVIGRMLARDPRERYRSMQRVIDDLVRCDQCIKTGHVEVVPHGTDSAFARDYELPQPGARKAEGPRGMRMLTTLLLIVLVGLVGYALGTGMHLRWLRPREAPAGIGLAGPVEPAPEEPPAPEPSAPPEQGDARRAFEKAMADWARYSRREDYEMGVAAFDSVARDFPESEYASRSRQEMARVYAEWARGSAGRGEAEAAVERYRKALELAPEDGPVARVARRALPGAMAALAEALRMKGDYDRAAEVYQQIADEFPGTKEAARVRVEMPGLTFSKAFMLWKDAGRHDEAMSLLLEVIRDHGDTEWADRAREAMPQLYLDAARSKIEAGQLGEAREQLRELASSYPGHKAAEQAADMDAEILFRWFSHEEAAGERAASTAHYAELLTDYGQSAWAVQAARIRLGLDRSEGDLYDSTTARNQLDKARSLRQEFDFSGAAAVLRGVLRYARAGSPEAAEALAALPRWQYESALFAYGKGDEARLRDALGELSTQFPGTAWDGRGAQALLRIEEPPEGMVYVPEGEYRMGTKTDELLALVRLHVPGELLEDDEGVKMFAEVAGLLSETPQHVARTDAFYVDRTEVTNEQYKQFVDATGTPPPAHWQNGTYPEGEANLPVVNVSLDEAAAYAQWRGARLPTEEEWEKAARGVDARTFPWGPVFDKKRCHHMRPEAAGPTAVGLYATWDSPYGTLDMIGNVREWTRSSPSPYPGSEWQGIPAPEQQVVARGGAWFQEELAPIPARCASRYIVDPLAADKATGFRCVVPVRTEETP
jgi:formylglycine-generating enzyme required for sulfatase activity/TolA-binding protein